MKKFKIFTILTLVLCAFIMASCYKDDNTDIPDTPDEILQNPFVKNANNESDFPV